MVGAQASASPRGVRAGSAAGQASSEFLLILGAVLIVGLVVVTLLTFYPGTSEEKTATASMAYWSREQPIAIGEAEAGGIHGPVPGGGAQGILLVLKNLDKEKLTIRAIDIGGSTNYPLFAGADIVLPSTHGVVADTGTGTCSEYQHTAHNCQISLDPGETQKFVVLPEESVSQCGIYQLASLNSLKKSISTPVSIYYEREGIVQLEKGAVDLVLECYKYFKCQTQCDCQKEFSCAAVCDNDNGAGNCVDHGVCSPEAC